MIVHQFFFALLAPERSSEDQRRKEVKGSGRGRVAKERETEVGQRTGWKGEVTGLGGKDSSSSTVHGTERGLLSIEIESEIESERRTSTTKRTEMS